MKNNKFWPKKKVEYLWLNNLACTSAQALIVLILAFCVLLNIGQSSLSKNPAGFAFKCYNLSRPDSLGGLLGGRTSDLGDSGYLAGLNNTLGFQGGLFDFGPQTSSKVSQKDYFFFC